MNKLKRITQKIRKFTSRGGWRETERGHWERRWFRNAGVDWNRHIDDGEDDNTVWIEETKPTQSKNSRIIVEDAIGEGDHNYNLQISEEIWEIAELSDSYFAPYKMYPPAYANRWLFN